MRRLAGVVESGPHTGRKVVTVVLVFDVALGVTFSVIGLRLVGECAATGQVALLARMNKVNWIRAQTCKSVGSGQADARPLWVVRVYGS